MLILTRKLQTLFIKAKSLSANKKNNLYTLASLFVYSLDSKSVYLKTKSQTKTENQLETLLLII